MEMCRSDPRFLICGIMYVVGGCVVLFMNSLQCIVIIRK